MNRSSKQNMLNVFFSSISKNHLKKGNTSNGGTKA